MKTQNSLSDSLKSVFASIVIPIEISIAICFYIFVLGDPSHFQGNDPANHPVQGDYFGIVYKGGPIVPILLSMLMITLTFGIERFITISRAKGKGSVRSFVLKIRSLITSNNIA